MAVGTRLSEIFPFNNKAYSNFVPSQNNNTNNLNSFFKVANSLDKTLSDFDKDSGLTENIKTTLVNLKILFQNRKVFLVFILTFVR